MNVNKTFHFLINTSYKKVFIFKIPCIFWNLLVFFNAILKIRRCRQKNHFPNYWSRWDSSDFAWKSCIPTNIALQTAATFSLCELAWEIRGMDVRPSIRLPRVCDYLHLFSVHDQLIDQLIVPTNAKLTLYKSAILPYLTYCHLTWHFCSATDKRKLERVQERADRKSVV